MKSYLLRVLQRLIDNVNSFLFSRLFAEKLFKKLSTNSKKKSRQIAFNIAEVKLKVGHKTPGFTDDFNLAVTKLSLELLSYVIGRTRNKNMYQGTRLMLKFHVFQRVFEKSDMIKWKFYLKV